VHVHRQTSFIRMETAQPVPHCTEASVRRAT